MDWFDSATLNRSGSSGYVQVADLLLMPTCVKFHFHVIGWRNNLHLSDDKEIFCKTTSTFGLRTGLLLLSWQGSIQVEQASCSSCRQYSEYNIHQISRDQQPIKYRWKHTSDVILEFWLHFLPEGDCGGKSKILGDPYQAIAVHHATDRTPLPDLHNSSS